MSRNEQMAALCLLFTQGWFAVSFIAADRLYKLSALYLGTLWVVVLIVALAAGGN